MTAARRRRTATLKRGLDLVLLVTVMPLAMIVIGVAAVAVRLDSRGPAFISQLRTGKDGCRFRMYKLRTMVRDAEELKASLAHLNVLPPPDFKIPDDPRITRVGRFLRATSIDELPQLLNVLRGEMCLVGPRPTTFDLARYSLWHTQRLDVRPGITGMWQVFGRGETTFDERLRLDALYIREMSLLLDVKLLLLTVGAVFRRTGA